MATKKYLDYAGLQELVLQINKKFAPIQAIVFKGSVDKVADLPALNTQKTGWMYNIANDGLTDANFVEGAGHEVKAGENVAAVEVLLGTYTKVTPQASDDPKALGWYEITSDSYNNVTATLPSDANPQALGLYELVGGSATDYILTTDTTVQGGKDYYERITVYELSQDRLPQDGKDYFTADTEMKWDLMGGIFDLESSYLEFGAEFPQGPADRMTNGRTFLYMGDDVKVYTLVASPEGRPSENGYFEGTFTEVADPTIYDNLKEVPLYEVIDGAEKYLEVTPVGGENPSDLGWYEEDPVGSGTYVLSADTTLDAGKTYYERKDAYVRTDDIEPQVGSKYFTGAFVASEDVTVDADKFYYTEGALYTKAVIYSYDATNKEWVAQSSSGSGDMVPITNAEIDDLFI